MEEEERPTKIPKLDHVTDNEEKSPPLSKNQLKKLRRQEEWESRRDERRERRREKAKEKRARKQAAKKESRTALDEAVPLSDPPVRSHSQAPITIIVDCGFDDLMTEKEIISLSSQLTRCYSENRNAAVRAHLAVSSFGGRLKERFDGVLSGVYKSWKGVRFFTDDYVVVSEHAKGWMSDGSSNTVAGALLQNHASTKGTENDADENGHADDQFEVVYLSSDSPNTLTELKAFSTYIIGGLVDKNRHKGICYKRATEMGIKTAKLPISEYMQMQSRSVLTTNHVNEIMLRWLDLGDWGKAFVKVIPSRKGGTLKVNNENSGDENRNEENRAIEALANSDASQAKVQLPDEGVTVSEPVENVPNEIEQETPPGASNGGDQSEGEKDSTESNYI